MSRRSRTRCPTGCPGGSPRARWSARTTCSSACTPRTGSSARPRPSRVRTPTARRRRPIVAAVRHRLGPALEGLDPLATELIEARCGGTPGDRVARGAIDLAVWDLVGQVLGQPCSLLLGGFVENVGVAHMVSFGEPAAMAEEALAMRLPAWASGRSRSRSGARSRPDIAAVTAVREALPDSELYVDANRGWSYEAALKAGEAFADLGVAAIEEPIGLEDRRGRLPARGPLDGPARRRRVLHQPPARGARARRRRSRHGQRESRAHRVHGVASHPRPVPGPRASRWSSAPSTRAVSARWRRWRSRPRSRGTARRPAEATNFLDLADDLLAEPPEIADGRMAPRPMPGLGIEIDEDRLDHYRIDR